MKKPFYVCKTFTIYRTEHKEYNLVVHGTMQDLCKWLVYTIQIERIILTVVILMNLINFIEYLYKLQ